MNHLNDTFYIISNHKSGYEMYQSDINSISNVNNWKLIVPQNNNIVIHDFEPFENKGDKYLFKHSFNDINILYFNI